MLIQVKLPTPEGPSDGAGVSPDSGASSNVAAFARWVGRRSYESDTRTPDGAPIGPQQGFDAMVASRI